LNSAGIEPASAPAPLAVDAAQAELAHDQYTRMGVQCAAPGA
jgi:hypothetical protein